MFRPEIAHYECSICGHKMQVLRTVIDEDTSEEYVDWDGEASFQLVLEHEEEHGL